MLLSSRIAPRRGFTLVEVLVAAGLTMLIMAVIATAFQTGMDTLSHLKSVGEMQQRLRAFETAVRADLTADHFDGRTGSGAKLSDQRLDLITTASADQQAWQPPEMGFFRIAQEALYPGSQVTKLEGTDQDGNPSTRAKGHMLHMTVKLDATRGDKLFTASYPSLTPSANAAFGSATMSQMKPSNISGFVSPWAEVVYFLDTAHQIGTTPGGLPLYSLHRRVRVLASGLAGTAWRTAPASPNDANNGLAQLQSMSFSPTTGMINGPVEIRDPKNRLGNLTSNRTVNSNYEVITAEQDVENGASKATGTDLMLADVLSFEVKANWDAGAGMPLPGLGALASTYDFPFSDLPPSGRNTTLNSANLRVFDTWHPAVDATNKPAWQNANTDKSVPLPIRVRAIQIKARVWDRKNNLARQVTVIQDM